MEFRTCPTCQASVLEDDVADCPFCGASMTGKPGAKPKPKAPAPGTSGKAKPGGASTRPETPAAKGATTTSRGTSPGQGRSGSSDVPPGEDDDPFGIDTTLHSKAIPLARQATKTRTILVQCPMCETEGYMAPADAGKHVRCGNANCMVPVFKSPKAVIEDTKLKEEAAPGLSPLIKYGAPLGLLAFAGASWFLYTSAMPNNIETPPVIPSPPITSNPTTNLPDDPVQSPTPPVVEKVNTRQLADDILKNVTAVADERRPLNRSFEYSRQLAAEMLAAGGRVPAAVSELARLENISRKTPYHQIEPLVELGWQSLAQGKRNDAETYAKRALALLEDPALPETVRRTLDSDIATTSLLAQLSLAPEALARLQQHPGSSPRARLAMLWAAAIHGHSFNLEEEAQLPWHVNPPCPVWVAVIETLISRGDSSAALQWCSQAPDVAAQEACFSAWAGRTVLKNGTGPLAAEVTQAIESQKSPTAKAGMWAAVAAARVTQKERGAADQALAQAVAALGELETPMPASLPGMKQIFDSNGKPNAGLPNPAPFRSRTLACASVAFVQLQLGQTEEGWATLQTALAWTRSIAPSSAATQKLLDECVTSEQEVKSRAASIAPAGTSEFLAFNQYRKQCGNLHAVALTRLNLQIELLKETALRGQLRPVWELAHSQTSLTDVLQQEPFLAGDNPSLLSVLKMEADVRDKALADEIAQKHGKPIVANTLDWLRANLPSLTREPAVYLDADAAMRREQRDSPDGKAAPFELDEILLRHFSIRQQQAPAGPYLELLVGIDATVDEDAFRLFGGWVGKAEQAEPVMKAIAASRSLEVTHKLSIHRGLIDSLP